MALIAARGIGKSFGSRSILHGLDFDIEPGARLGVIGPNGGGKSTLLRILAGEETADAGEVTQRRGLVVAFLPQQPEGDDARRRSDAARRAARPRRARARARRRSSGSSASRATTSTASRACCAGRRTCSRAGRRRRPGLRGPRPRAARRRRSRRRRSREADARPLRRPAQARRARRVPLARSRRPPARRARGAPRRRGARAPRGPDANVRRCVVAVSHDRYLLDETVTEIAELSGGAIRMWPRQLLRVHDRARARAAAAAAAVRHAAEGDRAARGGDPPVQGLGEPRRRRAPHQAGAQQAAADRPHGEDRPARARAAQDRARASPAPARRRARRRARRCRRRASAGRRSSTAST